MMRRIRGSKARRRLLQGAMAIAVIFGAATAIATPAAADDGDWWRYHRFGENHNWNRGYYDHNHHWHHYDRGGVYVYSEPRYYVPPTYYYPPPPPPTYYYAPPAPGFSFGVHVH
jgi:hypothetical protein